MSRTQKGTKHNAPATNWGDEEAGRRLNLAKTSPSAFGAAALPLVLVAAADEKDGGIPDPSSGGLLDIVNQLVDIVPGGWAGVAAAGAVGAGAMYLKLKAEASSVGPVTNRKTSREGFATKREIAEALSFDAMRENVARLRPSLAHVPSRQLAPTELGTLVGRDIHYRQPIYSPCEELNLLVGVPRVGKSAHIGGTILDAPGAVLATATRPDLYKHTAAARRASGPVYVFNDALAGVPNTLRWNPVRGCKNPDVAIRRARNILAAAAKGDDMANIAFFDDHACRLLRTFLMAADLIGGTLLHVQRWVTNPHSDAPVRILHDHHAIVPEGWAEAPHQALNTDPRLRDSVLMTLVRSFEFLASPSGSAMVQPGEHDEPFDVEQFIRKRGTLYMFGEEKQRGGIAPLFSCLAGEVYEVGKAMAHSTHHGRLDPQLKLSLDEAATIVPLPLHIWTNDAGGNGITIDIGIQNQAQLYQRWGRSGGQNIWSNCNKMVFGGLSVDEHLAEISALCGERDEEVRSVTTDKDGNKTETITVRQVPVMPKIDIRKIKKLHALYIFKNVSPVMVRFDPVWKRPDVKAAAKAEKKQLRAGKKEMKANVKAGIYPPMPQHMPPLIPQQPTGPTEAPAPAANPWEKSA